MKDAEAAEVRLCGLLHRLDFPRRWYDLCAASRVGGRPPSHDLPAAEQEAALATVGRAFKYNRREKFYATREAGVPGELGANLVLRYGVAEFILVARVRERSIFMAATAPGGSRTRSAARISAPADTGCTSKRRTSCCSFAGETSRPLSRRTTCSPHGRASSPVSGLMTGEV